MAENGHGHASPTRRQLSYLARMSRWKNGPRGFGRVRTVIFEAERPRPFFAMRQHVPRGTGDMNLSKSNLSPSTVRAQRVLVDEFPANNCQQTLGILKGGRSLQKAMQGYRKQRAVFSLRLEERRE